MTTATDKRMDGLALSKRLIEQCAVQAARIRAASGVSPTLATILVGEDPASQAYVRTIHKRSQSGGVDSKPFLLGAATTTAELVATLERLAHDSAVHAILLQHPLPEALDRRAAFESIPIAKDVDGVAAMSLGRVTLGLPAFASCTPAGIMRLLAEYQVALRGSDAVVIGRSPILGRPMAALLTNVDATVTVCHSRSRDLPDIVRRADLLVAAVGKPRFVRGDWIKPGAVVIDAGYHEGNVGDVEFEAALERASLITPVPGGVGPMTMAMLMAHTVQAAADQLRV